MLDMHPLTYDFGLAMGEEALPPAKRTNIAKEGVPEKATEKEGTKRLARCGKCANCCRQARALPPPAPR